MPQGDSGNPSRASNRARECRRLQVRRAVANPDRLQTTLFRESWTRQYSRGYERLALLGNGTLVREHRRPRLAQEREVADGLADAGGIILKIALPDAALEIIVKAPHVRGEFPALLHVQRSVQLANNL